MGEDDRREVRGGMVVVTIAVGTAFVVVVAMVIGAIAFTWDKQSEGQAFDLSLKGVARRGNSGKERSRRIIA